MCAIISLVHCIEASFMRPKIVGRWCVQWGEKCSKAITWKEIRFSWFIALRTFLDDRPFCSSTRFLSHFTTFFPPQMSLLSLTIDDVNTIVLRLFSLFNKWSWRKNFPLFHSFFTHFFPFSCVGPLVKLSTEPKRMRMKKEVTKMVFQVISFGVCTKIDFDFLNCTFSVRHQENKK